MSILLLKAVSDSDTTFSVTADPSLPQSNGLLLIGTEKITYADNYMGTLYGVTRGVGGTSAAAHLAGVSLALTDFYSSVSAPGTQSQLDAKAPKASPIFTGALTLPVLTTTQRDALTATKGMLIYNSTDDALNYYDGAWKEVAVV